MGTWGGTLPADVNSDKESELMSDLVTVTGLGILPQGQSIGRLLGLSAAGTRGHRRGWHWSLHRSYLLDDTWKLPLATVQV